MEFNEVKELILTMQSHPYMIAQKVSIYYPQWSVLIGHMVRDIDLYLEDENYVRAVCDEELDIVFAGCVLLPGIMLLEDEDTSWKIYEAIGLLIQNYGSIFEVNELIEIATALQRLTQTKKSLQALLIQTESVVVQTQAVINNSSTPYKLSQRFLTSILGEEK